MREELSERLGLSEARVQVRAVVGTIKITTAFRAMEISKDAHQRYFT